MLTSGRSVAELQEQKGHFGVVEKWKMDSNRQFVYFINKLTIGPSMINEINKVVLDQKTR